MRILLLAAALAVASGSARAEQAVDITMVYGAPGAYEDPPKTIVPAYPSLFVQFGSDGPQGMPEFSTADGTPIAIRGGVSLASYPHALTRVDLDIGQGVILVRHKGDERPIATYVVDPTYQPATRHIEVRPTGTLRVDSDAVAFRVVGPRGESVRFNDGRVMLELGKQQRVVALYSNGTEAVIFDGIPRVAPDPPEPLDPRSLVPQVRLKAMDLSPLPATLLLLLVLGLIGGLAARTND